MVLSVTLVLLSRLATEQELFSALGDRADQTNNSAPNLNIFYLGEGKAKLKRFGASQKLYCFSYFVQSCCTT